MKINRYALPFQAAVSRLRRKPERVTLCNPGATSWGTPLVADRKPLQRLGYIWLACIVAILVGGIAGAHQHHPNMWHTWRGISLAALSIAFLLWYLPVSGIWGRLSRGTSWSTRYWTGWLTFGFAITATLVAIETSFVGLTYALMGVSVFMPTVYKWLPLSIAVLLAAWAQGTLGSIARGHDVSNAIGGMVGLAASVCLVFALSSLIRERFRSELLLAKLTEANSTLRAAAAQEAEMATLRERNRLAREMHDSLGHALVSISIKLEAVRLLNPVNQARAAAELEDTIRLARSTMTDLRHSLAGLRPPALEAQPFPRALAALVEEAGRRAGLEATCSIDEQACAITCPVQEALYRVGQEALTNVAKHALAASVSLLLRIDDGNVMLEISDDGIGLPPIATSQDGHYGLQGMRERVEALGGILSLIDRTGGGTTVQARIPCLSQT